MNTAGIIGGLDFLGCDITLKFLAEDYRVKILEPPSSIKKQPVIRTGLKASDVLQIYSFDFEDHLQLKNFVADCDCLVHCGTPHELDVKVPDGTVYIPVISGTGCLLKALKDSYPVKKVIFLTSVEAFNFQEPDNVMNPLKRRNGNHFALKPALEIAHYRSEQIIHKILEGFDKYQLEVMIVSPVIVSNNTLNNNHKSTLAALRYLLRNKINHDIYFQKLIKRNLFETMINVDVLADKVFDCMHSDKKSISFLKAF
jgi:dihydroflavonol-4-reductase